MGHLWKSLSLLEVEKSPKKWRSILYHKSQKVIWKKTLIVSQHEANFVFSFHGFLFHVFALFLFRNKSIKGDYILIFHI